MKRNKMAATLPQAQAAVRGRPLLLYFVPTLVVAAVLASLATLMLQQRMEADAATVAREAAQQVVASLAARLETEIAARVGLMEFALADGRLAVALEQDDGPYIREFQSVLPGRVTGLMQLRVLSGDLSQPDPDGSAPLGYAGLDMVRKVAQTGRAAVAEIHQIKSDAPYLALAVPIQRQAAANNGHVLFAAWSMDPLVEVVASSTGFAGHLALLQGGDTGYVLARGPGSRDQALDAGSIEVPGSIWQLQYGLTKADAADDLLWIAISILVGLLLLTLVTLLQWRLLGRDLRADMAVVVNLGECILRREGASSPPIHLSSSTAAVALLVQYARQSRETSASIVAMASRAPAPANGGHARATGIELEELDAGAEDLLNVAALSPGRLDVAESLFRAYDVRGVVGETLSVDVAHRLGQAMGSLVREEGGQRVAVGRDARLSSPELHAALARGLLSAGCDVVDLGQVPTPLLYFAMQHLSLHAGVMVTGSHNPPEYNGFKIVSGDRVLDGDQLLYLRQRMLEGPFSRGQGSEEQIDLVDTYAESLVREVQLARPLKVVVDAGNGVAGRLAIAAYEGLGCEVVPLFCEPDGSFPNHHPDPSIPDNLASLMLEVQAQQADIGLAFDGDGDRLGVIDENGELVWPDQLLMLLAGDVLGRHPGVDILYDVKSSRHLASFVLAHGGRPIMWKSGHSRMRAKMQETGALLGGEFTGHFFIKERWFGFDDAIYAGARVLELLALEGRSSSAVFGDLPSSPATPEYRLPLEEGMSATLMQALDAHKVFDDARLVELDGLRVEFANGWGLIRPSNTTPALMFRFEADDLGALEQIKARFRELLRRVAPDMQAPF